MSRLRRYQSANRVSVSVSERGFTIVELMIALSVLSIILVISSMTMIQLGKLFTKGTNEANVQTITRNVMNDVASTIQLNSGKFVQNGNAFCIGTQRYTINPGQAIGSSVTTTYHALWRDTITNSANCVPHNLSGPGEPTDDAATFSTPNSGAELLSHLMRLNAFTIHDDGSSIYTITVTIIYGDDDTLNASHTACAGGVGSEYCAVSSLTDTVVKRLNN